MTTPPPAAPAGLNQDNSPLSPPTSGDSQRKHSGLLRQVVSKIAWSKSKGNEALRGEDSMSTPSTKVVGVGVKDGSQSARGEKKMSFTRRLTTP